MQLLFAAGDSRLLVSVIIVAVLMGTLLLLATRQTRLDDRSKQK